MGLFDVYQENDTMDLMLELCKGSMSNYIQERFLDDFLEQFLLI